MVNHGNYGFFFILKLTNYGYNLVWHTVYDDFIPMSQYEGSNCETIMEYIVNDNIVDYFITV